MMVLGGLVSEENIRLVFRTLNCSASKLCGLLTVIRLGANFFNDGALLFFILIDSFI
jgi:hypothetical protein